MTLDSVNAHDVMSVAAWHMPWRHVRSRRAFLLYLYLYGLKDTIMTIMSGWLERVSMKQSTS